MTDTTPTPDVDTIEWAAEMLGCSVAVDLAAKIAARDARRDAQTRADECDQIAHLMSAGDGAFDRYLAERLNEPGVMRGFLLGRADEHRERVQG